MLAGRGGFAAGCLDMHGLGGEGDLRAVVLDDGGDLQQHVLLDLVVVRPLDGLGEGVDEDVERRRGELVEADDQGGVGVDLGMGLQHGLHVGDDGGHVVEVLRSGCRWFP